MPSPARILLAESDDVLRAGIAEQLQREGYEIAAVKSSDEARTAQGPFAFAVIAHPLDGRDGEQLAAELRSDGLACPVLLLTESETETTQEFLARPFRFSALLAKLHALSTHHAASGVDLLDCERCADPALLARVRQRARDRVQDADLHGGALRAQQGRRLQNASGCGGTQRRGSQKPAAAHAQRLTRHWFPLCCWSRD